MITIYKYIIDPNKTEIEIQAQAEILSVAFQGANLCMWAKVDTEEELQKRNFQAFGTGHEIPRQMGMDFDYIGTGFMDNGLVFHLFERLGL